MDFCSEKELTAQTGHHKHDWPLVFVKELMDNALDASEEAGVAPEVTVRVDRRGITVADNGPGIPPETVAGVLDFGSRISSREAYVSPTRGAQGNALKTILAMPFVLHGHAGRVVVVARGVRHEITVRVDRIRQVPVIGHQQKDSDTGNDGTAVTVEWPDLACSILTGAEARFLQIADDFTFLNPHLTLTTDWHGRVTRTAAVCPGWQKWLPSDPTSPHWYTTESFARLVSGYLAHDEDHRQHRTVRELVAEFNGLSGTAKQKAVLAATGLARADLSALRNGDGPDQVRIAALLAAMRGQTRPVKPQALGVIGKENLARKFEALGCVRESFEYRKVMDVDDEGLPSVVETAFGWRGDEAEGGRRLVTGVNWSPGIVNPFRQLGKMGRSMDAVLTQMKATPSDPIIVVLHVACPRVQYTDRGKSAVVVRGGTGEMGE
jgi:DNA topoisomerase VI subunit B